MASGSACLGRRFARNSWTGAQLPPPVRGSSLGTCSPQAGPQTPSLTSPCPAVRALAVRGQVAGEGTQAGMAPVPQAWPPLTGDSPRVMGMGGLWECRWSNNTLNRSDAAGPCTHNSGKANFTRQAFKHMHAQEKPQMACWVPGAQCPGRGAGRGLWCGERPEQSGWRQAGAGGWRLGDRANRANAGQEAEDRVPLLQRGRGAPGEEEPRAAASPELHSRGGPGHCGIVSPPLV